MDPGASPPNGTSLFSSVFCTLSHKKSNSFKLSDSEVFSLELDEPTDGAGGGSLIDPGGGNRIPDPEPDPDLPVLGFPDDFFCLFNKLVLKYQFISRGLNTHGDVQVNFDGLALFKFQI